MDIPEFLSKKGGIELVLEISLEGSRFTELQEELRISPQTLSNRLKEADELLLLGAEAEQRERGRTPVYYLTPAGKFLYENFENRGMVRVYNEYKDARNQFQHKSEEMREWVSESGIPDEFMMEDEPTSRRSGYLGPDDSTFPPYHVDYMIAKEKFLEGDAQPSDEDTE